MEKLRNFPSLTSILTILLYWQTFLVKGQIISTPCTGTMISSFSPCMGYFITGSSRNGGSPTSACCDSLNSMMSNSMDCACLIVTGNVPLSLPNVISQALVISLPRACGTTVPIQCKASGAPLPPPGPILFAPPPPRLPAASPRHSPVASPDLSPLASSPFSPKASKALALLATAVPAREPRSEILTPASPPVHAMAPTTTPGIRPVLTPTTSASSPFYNPSSHILLVFIGMLIFNYY